MYINNQTLYLAGTDWLRPEDIDANGRNMLGDIKSSHKYNYALDKIYRNDVNKVVGFSLGGAIADKLADVKQIKQVRIYNSPSITAKNSHKKYVFYHEYDPIHGLFKKEYTKDMKLYKGHGYGHTMRNHKMIYN